MCGIIGYCGPKSTEKILIEGLKRLEYRGYDSAGICVLSDGELVLSKKKGKIRDLQPHIPKGLRGSCGIGHTRWATHGEVNDTNAHPHTDCRGRIAVVHNGIIENFATLKEKLISEGHEFFSETDSEVIPHLVEKYYAGDLEEAVKEALSLIKGTYGIVCMHSEQPDLLIGARQGSPLVLGIGDGEMFLASDVTAIISHTRQVVYLEDGDLLNIERVRIVAAGTSLHAGTVGMYLLESVARIPCTVEISSELRYRNPIVERNTLHFVVSQSGETADTLYAMRELHRKGATVLGICNVVGSTIARESDGGVYIHSGPEIAVASTKAFTSQITVLYLFTLLLSRMRDMSFEAGQEFIQNLQSIPARIETILSRAKGIEALAKKYCRYRDFLFLGRGINYPVAMEGALKLKEISYIHAEGYSAAELKHGPIALIGEDTPSVFLVPDDGLREKVISNIKEVKSRRGRVIAVAVEGDEMIGEIADDVIEVPRVKECFYPLVMVVPLQLFAYYCAVELGRDVDQPRNLAKSVTVE